MRTDPQPPRNSSPEMPSVALLQRNDGLLWSAVLSELVTDTHGIGEARPTSLRNIDGLISGLVDDITRYALPQRIAYPSPDGPATPLAFTSSLVAHRAERLLHAAELTAGALSALEGGALHLSSVAARALIELAIVCEDTSDGNANAPGLEKLWDDVHGSVRQVRAAASSLDSAAYRVVWQARMGTRSYDRSEGWPEAVNIMSRLNRINRFSPVVGSIYSSLCEITHPNAEASAAFWRTDSQQRIGGLRTVEFAPGRSNSPRKLDVVDAIIVSLIFVRSYGRLLWWIVADSANTCNITFNMKTLMLGLPARTPRGHLCSCGSGTETRRCRHPKPKLFDALG